jgi:nitrate reductase / nitrite oxidoreductase, beta subunit
MRVMAQVCMVMNLDKCIGCHTCSVTCKQTWTNRPGTEYVYFNNVETKPGLGYPVRYEDQEKWKGGWELDKKGHLRLRSGSRLRRLLSIFYNPDLPTIEDYHEPFTYDYAHLITAPAGSKAPSVSTRSALTGRDMNPKWGANWEDDLAGAPARALEDPNIKAMADKVLLDFESVFMFYLPRICEHCLNPSCVASCPSGAMYKRDEDGIVLVDQDRCRGWRFCVSGCPYKKVYFNHRTGKAEKCTLCYPRIEEGVPTICSETCVGRLRYLGLMLYDADEVTRAAATADPQDLYGAQLGVFLDPADPSVAETAERQRIPHDWLVAAQRSPAYSLIVRHRVALPLHPEFRTMPMVWYIPPLSPVTDVTAAAGYDDADPDAVFATIDALRVPVEYLANLFTAGRTAPVREALGKLAVLRAVMRARQLGLPTADGPGRAGMSDADADDLFRLLAIARYEDRYVVPPAHKEDAGRLLAQHSLPGCSLETDGGPGMGGGTLRAGVGTATFHLTKRDEKGRLHIPVAGGGPG